MNAKKIKKSTTPFEKLWPTGVYPRVDAQYSPRLNTLHLSVSQHIPFTFDT